MATILKFRVRDEGRPGPDADRLNVSAEIVIFPGVRRQRSPEGQAPLGKGRSKVKRDTLTIGE